MHWNGCNESRSKEVRSGTEKTRHVTEHDVQSCTNDAERSMLYVRLKVPGLLPNSLVMSAMNNCTDTLCKTKFPRTISGNISVSTTFLIKFRVVAMSKESFPITL